MATKATPAHAPAKPGHLTIDVTPSKDAAQAMTLLTTAQRLVVTDRDSHAGALEFLRGAKQLKRSIEDHWTRITRSVDDLKRNLLNLKRADLQPVEDAIAVVTRLALDYENTERKRVEAEQAEVRRQAVLDAEAKREQEARDAELKALQAEQNSPDLSARERVFVTEMLTGCTPTAAAVAAGYADAAGRAARLLATPKIVTAIAAQREANAIREQAAAAAAKPVEVVVPVVQAELGKQAGVSTRTTYGAEVVDKALFMAAVLDGVIPTDYVSINLVELNRTAAKAPPLFEQAFPGCRLVTKQTIAG